MTRRLLFKYALGSTTGAGAAGAAAGAEAGAATGAEAAGVEQELQVLQGAAQASHALASQHDFFLHEKIFESKPQLRFEPHPQPLSHVAAAAQGSQAAISAPQLGPQPAALPHGSQAAISAPQLGPQPALHPAALPHGSQAAISAPQLGPQLAAAPQPLLQQAVSAPQLGAHRLPHGEARLHRSPLIAFSKPSNGFLRHPHDGASTPQLGPHPADAPQGSHPAA